MREERIVVPSVEIREERKNVTIGVSQAEREALLIETEAREALRMNVTHEDREVRVVREERVEPTVTVRTEKVKEPIVDI